MAARARATSAQRKASIRRRRILALLVVSVLVCASLEIFVKPADVRARHGASLSLITIDSKDVGKELQTAVVVPSGADSSDHRPLFVFLHGRGGSTLAEQPSQVIYDALAAQGKLAPIVAMPAGDDHSYWHDRHNGDENGDWAKYVINEVIPRVVSQFGADPQRVAIGGISMGGFGALDLARLHPGRFCAVGAHSPALWHTGGETAAGAFDDAADFDRHDVIGSIKADPRPLLGKPVWIDGGSEDPFRPGFDDLASTLRADGADLSFHVWPGGHGGSYWGRHWGSYMRFYSHSLAHCKG